LRQQFNNALVAMGVSRDGPKRMHFRTSGKMLIDLKNCAESMKITACSGLKVKRASVSGTTVQS